MPLWVQVLAVVEVFFVAALIAAWATHRTRLIFAAGFNVMIPVIALYLWHAPALYPRALLGATMAALYLLRLNAVILWWTNTTAMSKLDAALPAPAKLGLAFVLAHAVGLGYCLPFYYTARDGGPLGVWDGLAVAVYLVGTVFHAGGDYQKRRFKLRADTRGKLLSSGLWSLCRHPNYFGDFLIYVSFAVLARNPWAWISPALNLLQYLFDAIPKSEQWAAEKYGAAWAAYAASTPMFVPRPPRSR